MQKCALYLVVAIIFGALGFGFAKFCPLAAPKTVTVSQVLSINSASEVRNLRNAKLAELAKLLEQITDAPSAASHRPAAEQLFLEIQLITARFQMIPIAQGEKLDPALTTEHPLSLTRTQLLRLAKDEEITRELNPSLAPLFRECEINIHTAKSAKITLMSELQTLRSQIALYRLQHNDLYPEFKKYGWKQLAFRTNGFGQVTESDRAPGNSLYGPYIQILPQNPLTKSSEVLVVDSLPDNFKANGSYGFVFEASGGRLFALTASGQLFDESSASADIR